MVDPIEVARWQVAQRAESEYWSDLSAREVLRVAAENAAAGQWAAEQIPAMPDGDWIEIGIGPLGMGCIHFLPGADNGRALVGIEPLPLIDVETLVLPEPVMQLTRGVRAQRYEHVQAKGEDTGLAAGRFSFGVCYNVLDHVHDPMGIMRELHRVLRPGGKLLLAVDTHSLLSEIKFHAYVKRRYANSIGVRAHPHHFSIPDVRAMAEATGFRILAERVPARERVARLIGRSYRVHLLCERRDLGS